MRTLILTDKEGWHYNELKKSLIKLGHSVFSACLTNISIKLDDIKAKLFINNEPIPEGDNVIVRFVPGGTLEEIVYFLNILKILESKGVNVINNASSIEKTVDKLHTSYLLNKNNIKTPLTYVLRGQNEAYEFIKNYHKELIYKPLFGKLLTREIKCNEYEICSSSLKIIICRIASLDSARNDSLFLFSGRKGAAL